MITALDASVLWAIIKQEPGHVAWVRVLLEAAAEGTLVISPVAFAELAPATPDAEELRHLLAGLSIRYDAFSEAAAHLAGITFKRYRKAGGPREHLVPDFLIAAHAQVQANRLAAIDRGYMRKWFPALTLLVPTAA
jgi:predicted nucleic acid-binding protein